MASVFCLGVPSSVVQTETTLTFFMLAGLEGEKQKKQSVQSPLCFS